MAIDILKNLSKFLPADLLGKGGEVAQPSPQSADKAAIDAQHSTHAAKQAAVSAQVKSAELLRAAVKAQQKSAELMNALSGAASKFLASAGSGSAAKFTVGDYYFPAELIAGTTPRIKGQERELAWNAAAEACDTERVHLVWDLTEERVWFVAVRAADMASHPHSWCPFASLLPGMKDAQPPPVCYTYYSDETATMLTLTTELVQIHRGTSSVVRAKAERVSRELGGAPVIDLTPEKIAALTPQPWYSMSLFEDKLRRMITLLAAVSGLSVSVLAFVIWLLAGMSLLASRANLEAAKERSAEKSKALMEQVEKLRASVLHEQLAKFMQLNDDLVQMSGWLKSYEIRAGGRVVWKAIVPGSITGDRIRELGGKTVETNDMGVVISNDPAALTDPKK